MKKKVIVFIFALALFIVSVTTANVYAINNDGLIYKESPMYNTRWTNIVSTNTSVEEEDSKIKANAVVITRNNAYVNAKLYLQKYKNGHWSVVKSWNVEGSGYVTISKLYSGSSGNYRTKFSMIYTTNTAPTRVIKYLQ